MSRLRWNVLWLPAIAAMWLAGLPAGARSASTAVATAAVQVTRNPDPLRAHASPQIARNPRTGELVIAETEVRTAKTCNVHVSVDDGRSWFPGGDPMVKPWTDCSGDPDANVNLWLEYDREGTLYMAFPANEPQEQVLPKAERRRHIFLARSQDGGRSFETTMVWRAPETGTSGGAAGNRNGRTWLAVDPNDPRYVYVTWMNWRVEAGATLNRPMVAASSDGGRTFAAPVNLGEEGRSWYEPRPAVDGEGVVHVLVPSRESTPPGQTEAPIRSAFHRASTDRGRSWSAMRMVDQGNAGFSFARKWGLKADPSSNTLYVVWYGNQKPRATRPEDDRHVFLRVSEDSGRTWTEPRTVNDDTHLVGVQHYDPGMSIAPDGRLDIAWFDFRNSPEPETENQGNFGGFQDVYYSSTSDRGSTLRPNVRITDRLIDRRVGVWSNRVHIHAPVGIVSTNDVVYFTWQDTRNGNSEMQAEDVYFATLPLTASAPVVAGSSGVPLWALAAAGVAVGMGVAALLLLALSGRFREKTARA